MTNTIRNMAVVAVILMLVSIGASLVDTSDADSTADGFVYGPSELEDDGYSITGYNGTDRVISIPSSLGEGNNIKPVIEISNNAFSGSSIEEVLIPSTVESIGNSAFYQCKNLRIVTIEGSPAIGASAFMFDSSLELIDFKNNPVSIGSNAFMKVNDCVVRVPSVGILDKYAQGTNFSYIDTSSHIVRLTSTNAPDTVTIPDFVVVENGMKLSLPSTIKTQGYDIRMTADSSEIGDDYVPTADVTIVLDYWIQSYNVNFTVDGETYQTYRFDYGETVTAPTEDPVKEQDERNTYEFTGWKGFTDGMTVTGDMTFEAQFQEILRDYTVSFVSDGKDIQTQTLHYGDAIVKPAQDPVKESSDGIDYTFTGWKGFTDGMTVTGDMTFEAQFAPSDHEYTITFKVDGETVQEMKLKYGETVVAPAEAPEKDGFEFTGWSGYEENMTVTGDMTFEAQFQEIPQDDGSGDDTMLYAGAAVAIVIVIILALLLLRRFL